MTLSIQTVQAKIERVVRRDSRGAVAEFLRDGEWFCCTAWILNPLCLAPYGKPQIYCRASTMTPEEAAIVGVALQMALDWIAEEMAKTEEASPVSEAIR